LITIDEALRLKEQLLALLDEDAANQERILDRLDSIRSERGIEAHAALMLILTGQSFDEEAARRQWEAIVHHRDAMSGRVGRDVGLRVAAFDYFVNVNRRASTPRLIDLHISDPAPPGALEDPATGLANERALRVALQAEVRRARRYGPGFAVARLDVDGLGRANERFGALVGDALVRECAMLIRGRTRDLDTAARLTGGEFALVLPETDRLGGTVVCERIRREAERFFADREAGGRPVDLTLSGGLAKYPEDGTSPEELLQRAGDALYLAKSRGKNTIAVYYQERRNYIRFDAHGRGLVLHALADPQTAASVRDAAGAGAVPENVSRTGMLFSSERPWPIGQELLLDLRSPDGAEAQTVRARVVRVEESDGEGEAPHFEVGVAYHFDRESEEQEYLSFFDRWSRPEPGP